jgi:hypothetical protein
MRYTLTKKSRQPFIVAALLAGAGALAAVAAAHVNRGGSVLSDIALLEPAPPKAAASRAAADIRPEPLMHGRSRASRLDSLPDAAGSGAAGSRQERSARDAGSSGAYETRYVDTGYRDFAGERRRNAAAGGGSRSRASGGGGGGGVGGGVGGGGWGGSATASAVQSTSGTASNGSGGGSSGNSGQTGNGSARGSDFEDNVGVPARGRAAGAVATSLAGAFRNSPGAAPTPEPLTILLVASGLAGLYGARKHLV